MRAIFVLLLLAAATVVSSTGTRAAPGPSDLAAALLTSSDLPDGWAQQAWDWQRTPIPDEAGNLISLGIATSAEPRPSVTQLGENNAGVEFVQRAQDGYIYRGVQHAVIAVPEGQGAALFAVLREAMRTGTLRFPEPGGATNVWDYTAMDPPALGDEAYALRLTVWDELPGGEVPTHARGVLYAFRRGDYIAIFSHIDGAFPERALDTALTDRLAGVADGRLATLAGEAPPVTEDGDAG